MKVDVPMPPSRRRRGWMLWMLWGMLGTALTFEGTSAASLSGATLPMVLLLTAPSWALFALWPVLWVFDRLRACRLWGEELWETEGMDGSIVTLVRGRDVTSGRPDVWVPLSAISRVPEGLKELKRAETLPGIHEEGVLLSELVRWRKATAVSEDSEVDSEVEALRAWVLALVAAQG